MAKAMAEPMMNRGQGMGKVKLPSPRDNVEKLDLRSYNGCIYVFSFADSLPGGLRFGDQLLGVKDKCVTGLKLEDVLKICKDLSKESEITFRPSSLTETVILNVGSAPSAGIKVTEGVIANVEAGSPAAEAGLLLNSRIIKIDNKDVTHLSDDKLLALLDKAGGEKSLLLAPKYLFTESVPSPSV
ncbi:unnamed protein product [Dibothriocephalus latus]|uniref:PDZ domain-containing protein n=1 Tax=Dibothriocephalus latus TaxID=60516 RepID=A0A3P7QTK7_DIBLA|nr:unnamed protein product [Dibothriocephalus latus]